MKTKLSVISSLLLAGFIMSPASHGASVTYDFDGQDLTPTLSGLPAGVSASNFSIGSFGSGVLQSDALRVTDAEVSTSTTTSISDNTVLSFSLTIPSNVTLNLTSLTFDYTSSGIPNDYFNGRTYSSIDGSNSVTGDTIGFLGKGPLDPTSATGVIISLADPAANRGVGGNISASDFENLSNQTVEFYMPMITDADNIAADYIQFDNVSLNFAAIPEPSATLIAGLALVLAMLRRRR